MRMTRRTFSFPLLVVASFMSQKKRHGDYYFILWSLFFVSLHDKKQTQEYRLVDMSQFLSLVSCLTMVSARRIDSRDGSSDILSSRNKERTSLSRERDFFIKSIHSDNTVKRLDRWWFQGSRRRSPQEKIRETHTSRCHSLKRRESFCVPSRIDQESRLLKF